MQFIYGWSVIAYFKNAKRLPKNEKWECEAIRKKKLENNIFMSHHFAIFVIFFVHGKNASMYNQICDLFRIMHFTRCVYILCINNKCQTTSNWCFIKLPLTNSSWKSESSQTSGKAATKLMKLNRECLYIILEATPKSSPNWYFVYLL